MGEGVLPGVLTVLEPWRLAGTVPCTNKKAPVLRLLPHKSRGAAAGVRSNTFIVPLILAHRAFRSQQQGSSGLRRQDTGSASRADAAPIFLRIPKPFLTEQSGAVAREIQIGQFGGRERPSSPGCARTPGITGTVTFGRRAASAR